MAAAGVAADRIDRQERRRSARGPAGGGVAASRAAAQKTSCCSRPHRSRSTVEIRGAVVLEQAGDQLLDLRDRALAHLFDLTLLATALAVVFAFSVATFISVRIGRLRSAADSAVGNDGRIRLEMPESRQRR